MTNRIYLQLPKINAHTNHAVTEEEGFSHRIHPMVKAKIYQLVGSGITSCPVIKSLLDRYIIHDLCRYDTIKPLKNDRSYFPTSRDIKNHIHKALVAGQYSALDVDNLELKMTEWKEAEPNANFYLRKCKEKLNSKHPPKGLASDEPADSNSADDVEDNNTDHLFMFVHQSEQQRQLLHRYGDMVLLDATYKTSKYALPLFIMAVRTNVGYIPVAEFVVEEEDSRSIAEALGIIKEWMAKDESVWSREPT